MIKKFQDVAQCGKLRWPGEKEEPKLKNKMNRTLGKEWRAKTTAEFIFSP